MAPEGGGRGRWIRREKRRPDLPTPVLQSEETSVERSFIFGPIWRPYIKDRKRLYGQTIKKSICIFPETIRAARGRLQPPAGGRRAASFLGAMAR